MPGYMQHARWMYEQAPQPMSTHVSPDKSSTGITNNR
jgi:hypothetical protein